MVAKVAIVAVVVVVVILVIGVVVIVGVAAAKSAVLVVRLDSTVSDLSIRFLSDSKLPNSIASSHRSRMAREALQISPTLIAISALPLPLLYDSLLWYFAFFFRHPELSPLLFLISSATKQNCRIPLALKWTRRPLKHALWACGQRTQKLHQLKLQVHQVGLSQAEMVPKTWFKSFN